VPGWYSRIGVQPHHKQLSLVGCLSQEPTEKNAVFGQKKSCQIMSDNLEVAKLVKKGCVKDMFMDMNELSYKKTHQ
jgi:hypothetical protein